MINTFHTRDYLGILIRKVFQQCELALKWFYYQLVCENLQICYCCLYCDVFSTKIVKLVTTCVAGGAPNFS